MNDKDECPICLAKEKIENVVRSFLRESQISHLDAIIALIQSHNAILGKLEKRLGKNETLKLLKSLDEFEIETFNLACHISMAISDEAEGLKNEINHIKD